MTIQKYYCGGPNGITSTDGVIDSIVSWGQQHGIDNPDKQTVKLLEECGELAHEISRGRYNSKALEDAIGDVGVVLIILADILGYDFVDCLDLAYNEIKDRKGKTVGGGFVKEEAKPEDERVNYQSY